MKSDLTTWSVAVGLVSGVALYVLSQLAWQTLRRNRLINALLVEAVATLHRFDPLDKPLADGASQPLDGITIDIACVRGLYSGFILSKPIEAPIELIWLLQPQMAVNVINFYDGWTRFVDFEARYAQLHERLLLAAIQQPPQPELLAEYWDQTVTILRSMNHIANELRYYSCLLFCNHAPRSDDRLGELCQQR